MLPLETLLIHKLVYQIVRIFLLNQGAGDQKQDLAQVRRTPLGYTSVLRLEGSGLARRSVDSGKGHKSVFVLEPPDVAYLSY